MIYQYLFLYLDCNNPCIGEETEADSAAGGRPSTTHHVSVAQQLFPSSLCSAVLTIIHLLDDPAVTPDGMAVYQVAHQVCSYQKLSSIPMESLHLSDIFFYIIETAKNYRYYLVSASSYKIVSVSGNMVVSCRGLRSLSEILPGKAHERATECHDQTPA